MSARDEGHQHGTKVRSENSGLDAHPISVTYRSTLAIAAYQGGVRAGALGYGGLDTDDGAAFAEGFLAGLYGRK